MADIKILDLEEATEITETTDYIPVVDTSDTTQDSTGTTKKATVRKLLIEVLKKAYPIGSVYINASNATNPASLLGFGTWSAFGAGKVMVGLDAGDTSFDTAGETGGEKTHTLTVAEMPSHKHSVYGFQTSPVVTPNNQGGGIALDDQGRWTMLTSSSQGVQNTGGGGSHNNLQPYIVVYFWKRTA